MARASTFTNYIKSDLDPRTGATYRNLETIANRTYDSIARHAGIAAAAGNRVSGAAARGTGSAAASAARQQDLLAQAERRVGQAAQVSGGQMSAYALRMREAQIAGAGFNRTLDATATTLNVVQGPLGPLSGRVRALSGALTELSGVRLGLAGAGAAIFGFVSASSKFTEIESKLRPLYETQEEVNGAFQRSIRISETARSALAPTVDLYAKLTAAGRDFGIEQSRIAKVTELAAKTATLSGGSTQAREAGIYQFAQGLGSGTLAGDELKSIKENIPELARAIAAGYKNADGSIGTTIAKLKELGAEGELSAEVIVSSLERAEKQINTKFERLPLTLGQATTQFGNSLTTIFGAADRTLGLTSNLAALINVAAENMRGLISLAAGVGAAFVLPKIGSFIGDIARATSAYATLRAEVAAGNATLLTQEGIAAAKAKSVASAARVELQSTLETRRAIKQKIVDLRAEADQYRANIPIIERQARASRASAETAKGLAAAGQFAGQGGALKAQIADETALARTRAGLRASTKALEDAERALTVVSGTATTQKGKLTAATTAGTLATKAATAATSLLGGALRLLGSALPILAITALVTVITSLITAEDDATRSANAMANAQDTLGQFVDRTTGKIIAQNQALVQNRILQARETKETLSDSLKRTQAKLLDERNNPLNRSAGVLAEGLVLPTDVPENIAKMVDQVARTGRGVNELYAALDQFEAKNPTRAQAIKKSLGDFVVTANAASQNAAEIRVLTQQGRPGDLQKSFGDFTGASQAKNEAAKARSKAQLEAEADSRNAQSALEKAQASLKKVKADGVGSGTEEEYITKLAEAKAAVDSAKDAQKALNASRTAGAKATREAAAAEKALQVEEQRRERRTEKVTRIRENYDEAPRMIDRAKKDARELQSIVGETINLTNDAGDVIGQGLYTQEAADADKARIAEGLQKPFNDILLSYEREAQLQNLILQGRDVEAQALRDKFQLIDQVGTLEAGQYQQLVRAAQRQEDLNLLLEERARRLSVLTGVVDDVRGAAEQFLNDLPSKGLSAGKDLLNNIFGSFRAGQNRLLIESIFGGMDKKVQDFINGKTAVQEATDYTAQKFTETGDSARTLAATFREVSSSLRASASDAAGQPFSAQLGGIGGPALNSSRSVLDIGKEIGKSVSETLEPAGNVPDGGEIIVTAKKTLHDLSNSVGGILNVAKQDTQRKKPVTLREVYNETGRSIGEKLDQALGTKFAGKVGAKLGDVLGGVQQGQTASAIASAIGIKQSKTGASIGGAIGGATGIPGAGYIGGFIGGTIGGLFKKNKYGTATLTGGDEFDVSGNSSARREQASGLGSGVQSGIAAIAKQLGADLGSYNVSVGTYKDMYRVSTSGYAGKLDFKGASANNLYNFGDDQQAAIEFAIRDAISDGALKGITAASQRIIAAGKDLQTSIEKAVLIESIPKRLMQIQSPVKYAITELNREFETIIKALNEGQATAQQYADAQTLYDLERAEALKQAQDAATGAIQQMLDDMLNSQASPLNKATVYDNASTKLNGFVSDINSGKAVDQDDLVAAAQNFQEASRALNGSSLGFFNDFNFLIDLLNKAKINGGVGAEDLTNLPTSPFDNTAVQNAISGGAQQTVAAIDAQTTAILAGLQGLGAEFYAALVAAGGRTGTSSLNLLPAYR